MPIRCPVAGKFKFAQKGDIKFETRILGGVTDSPRPDVYCKENISDFSVCDTEQKEIWIDENYCLSVDYKGRPVDIYSTFFFSKKSHCFARLSAWSLLLFYFATAFAFFSFGTLVVFVFLKIGCSNHLTYVM